MSISLSLWTVGTVFSRYFLSCFHFSFVIFVTKGEGET